MTISVIRLRCWLEFNLRTWQGPVDLISVVVGLNMKIIDTLSQLSDNNTMELRLPASLWGITLGCLKSDSEILFLKTPNYTQSDTLPSFLSSQNKWPPFDKVHLQWAQRWQRFWREYTNILLQIGLGHLRMKINYPDNCDKWHQNDLALASRQLQVLMNM